MLLALFAVMAFIVVVIAVALAFGQPESMFNIEELMDLIMANLGLTIAVAGIGSYSIGTALILAIIKVRNGKSIGEYLGLKRVGWKVVLLLLLITSVYLVLVSVVANLLNIPEDETNILVEAYQTSVWPALFWIVVVVFAPIFEEPFARGFLFEGFRHSRIGLAGAILLTSLIWTGLHVGNNLYSLGAIFIFGIVLGYVRYQTGSLWSTVLMHAFYNLVGVSLIAVSTA